MKVGKERGDRRVKRGIGEVKRGVREGLFKLKAKETAMVKIGNLDLGTCPLLLAPMEDVSDPPFRALCKAYGADMMYTEFISSEGLIRHAVKSVEKLDIFPSERPIGIQIFGDKIASMQEAAGLAEAVSPDVIDINYGCPVKKVVCKGAGAGILLDLPKMQAMTEAIVRQVRLPVTVKTRLGWDEKNIRIKEVALRLQDAGISALSVHARTRRQMYKGEANWDWLAELKADARIKIPIFGNGDIDSGERALAMRRFSGVDGLMIGRAAIGAPWIFSQIKHYMKHGEVLADPSLEERARCIHQHLDHAVAWKGVRRGVLEMRRHYSRYLRGTGERKKAVVALMAAQTPEEVHEELDALCKEAFSPVALS